VLEALNLIYRYRYLTAYQVAMVTGLQSKSISETLLRLERQKLLGHFGNVGMRGYGKTPKVYYLTKQGHNLLQEENEAAGFQVGSFSRVNTTSRWSPQMFHRLDTIDVLMALERDVNARPAYTLTATLTEYRREKIGGEWVGETTDYISGNKDPKAKIVPDAGFILENVETGRKGLFLIEVDRGTETQHTKVDAYLRQSFKHKIEQYDRYLQSGSWMQRYAVHGDFAYFTCLIITNSKQRMANMRATLSELTAVLHQYHRLSDIEDVRADFFHDRWLSRDPTDLNHHRLIKEASNES